MRPFKTKLESLIVEFSLLTVAVCMLLIYFARHVGLLALAVMSLAVIGLGYLQRLMTKRRSLATETAGRAKLEKTEARADLYLKTIEALAIAIDAKDQTSQGHVRRTQVYATEIGKLLNVSPDELEALRTGALLHDIGKLAVPEYILNKPGHLTKAESSKMQIHPTVGGEIISGLDFPYPIEDVVRYHHERWDGTGYPDGLKCDSIPLVARIISVVDFYDATRCDRPFRLGMSREESLSLLSSMSGSAFDPDVVAMFVRHVAEFDLLISPDDLSEQAATLAPLLSDTVKTCSVDDSTATSTQVRNPGFISIVEAQKEVFALHEIAQTIGSSLNLKDTVALVLNRLIAMVPFDACVIYLMDEKSEKAFPVDAVGEFSSVFSGHSVTIGDGVTGWVIASGRTTCSRTPSLDLPRVPEEIASQFKHALVTPLICDDGVFGAIALYSTTEGQYTTDHVRLIETVSQYVSSALNNALTFEKTRESALFDPLTELPNYRAFFTTLEHRMAECQRLKNREPITVFYMDLDDFKRINDHVGHGVGDRILKSVAAVIRGQLRQMDTLARYAGDEFTAILPMASHKTAFLIAERIQATIGSHKFFAQSEDALEIGISIGIAAYPEDGETAERLLTVARLNLQHDKASRRIAPSLVGSTVTSLESFRLR